MSEAEIPAIEVGGTDATWGGFKKAMEQAGVRDEEQLSFIDIGDASTGIQVWRDRHGHVCVL